MYTVTPIGFVRSPFGEKVLAPRQPVVAEDVTGTIEVLGEYRDALDDLASFDRIWVVFWFDRSSGWRPKVQPPRSDVKRGVFATRSPHRPNPIGLSAVRLDRIEGTTLHVRELDLVEGTPVLDLKPYLPYADAFPEAGAGWLAADPRPAWTVTLAPEAEEAAAWVLAQTGLPLRDRIVAALSLGPKPHAYRRIKETPAGPVLAVKEWRAAFRVGDGAIEVRRVASGYRPRELEKEGAVYEVHRAFVARFGIFSGG